MNQRIDASTFPQTTKKGMQIKKMIFFISFNIFCVLMPLSAISWQPVLVVEEGGVHGENHRPWTSNW